MSRWSHDRPSSKLDPQQRVRDGVFQPNNAYFLTGETMTRPYPPSLYDRIVSRPRPNRSKRLGISREAYAQGQSKVPDHRCFEQHVERARGCLLETKISGANLVRQAEGGETNADSEDASSRSKRGC